MVQKERLRGKRHLYPQTLNVLQENVTNSLIVSFNVGVRTTLPKKEKDTEREI